MTPTRCAEIHQACFTTPRPWSEAEFTDLLACSNVFLCTAPTGFALGRIAGPEAELLTIAVEPSSRNNGVGRGLLAQFERHCLSRNVNEVFLEVSDTNAAAIALYESADFAQCGHRKDYYQSPNGARVGAIVYRKQLLT